VAARVTGAGAALDPAGIRLNRPPTGSPGGSRDVFPAGIAFDGTAYLTTFLVPGPRRADGSFLGYHIFGARLTPGGTVLDDETEGLLLSGAGTAASGRIAATSTHAMLAWADSRNDVDGDAYTEFYGVQAGRVLGRVPALPVRAIGTIGPQHVAEGTPLAFVVSAPGLTAPTFSASDLPPGAFVDAATGAFRWQPGADQAGSYPGIIFRASAGGQLVNEVVTITVDEAVRSLAGTVEQPAGAPLVGAAIKLGGPGGARILFSDAAGRFRFDGLVPGNYKVRLGRPTIRQYALTPVPVTVGASDVTGVRLVVTPK
jgi:hypothetical protein